MKSLLGEYRIFFRYSYVNSLFSHPFWENADSLVTISQIMKCPTLPDPNNDNPNADTIDAELTFIAKAKINWTMQ